MRINAINMLRHASRNITANGKDYAYDFALAELATHLAAVRDGEHTWAEFAEAYCLTERDRKPKSVEATGQ